MLYKVTQVLNLSRDSLVVLRPPCMKATWCLRCWPFRLFGSTHSIPILFNPGSHSNDSNPFSIHWIRWIHSLNPFIGFSIHWSGHVAMPFSWFLHAVDGVHLPDGLGAGLQSVRPLLRPQQRRAMNGHSILSSFNIFHHLSTCSIAIVIISHH